MTTVFSVTIARIFLQGQNVQLEPRVQLFHGLLVVVTLPALSDDFLRKLRERDWCVGLVLSREKNTSNGEMG